MRPSFSRSLLIGIILLISLPLIVGGVINNLSMDETAQPLILERVDINGSKQWVSLSEEPTGNGKPVLLFLHGGPGSANISLLNKLCPGMNSHAVVVNWDQRMAGKSYRLFGNKSALNLEQLVLDAHELTQHLKRKYDVERITLMGFSAGSILGMLLIDRYPGDYNLYIGVGQMVDGQRGELLSLDFTLQKAKELDDSKAIRKLERIQFDFYDPKSILQQTKRQRPYLLEYGGVYHTYSSYGHEAKALWRSREYSFIDFLFWPRGSVLSLKRMWHECVLINLEETVPTVSVPVVFISGKYDMNCPVTLVKEYHEVLVAPKGKELIIIEDAAHGVFWDNPERFQREVIGAIERFGR